MTSKICDVSRKAGRSWQGLTRTPNLQSGFSRYEAAQVAAAVEFVQLRVVLPLKLF